MVDKISLSASSDKTLIYIGPSSITIPTEQWFGAEHSLYVVEGFPSVALLMENFSTKKNYCAVIIEMKLLLKMSPSERQWFYNNLDQFPLFRLRLMNHPESGTMSIMNQPEEITDLIAQIKKFRARGIRRFTRYNWRENISLYAQDPSGSVSQKGFQATTKDISVSGCFAVDTAVTADMPNKVWVAFKNQPSHIPATPANVVWITTWAQNKPTFPGWGLEFCEPNTPLSQWIDELVSRRQPSKE